MGQLEHRDRSDLLLEKNQSNFIIDIAVECCRLPDYKRPCQSREQRESVSADVRLVKTDPSAP